MATLTVQNAAESGGLTMVSAAAGGDVFPNDGKTVLVIWNDHTGAQVVTVTAQDTTANAPGFGAVTKADAVSSVETVAVDVMGPFPTTAYNNASGQCAVTYDAVVAMTVAAVRVN